MSLLTTLPSALRTAVSRSTTRAFSTTPPRPASVLFALHALSNSRETQHFNKLSHLNRIEHSPPLKLIKTSEVDPYPLPALPPTPAALPLVRALGSGSGLKSAARAWDAKALKAGRAILASNARQVHRLQQALQRAKSREARHLRLAQQEKAAWQQEVRRHHREMRAAGVWILLSIGTATGLAMWRFWPPQQRVGDSGELGRRLAATARGSVGLPGAVGGDAVSAAGPGVAAAEMPKVVAAPAGAVAPVVVSPPAPAAVAMVEPQRAGWWRSLFWKQQ
ncbi:hypothetical protein B0A55_09679 [Friedmanniomyces simplex]|uniref:Uncharacterized protein n=1 Tax=Friedmanniomyces simplex TaxID=329884 RepID=A0A4V5NH96_9PEZI|nr:hypothetical protein B0A55_09679 [Friedmanniomyces simplex]